MRIDKLFSDMGLLSRRECAAAVRRGDIRVDGKAVKSASEHVDPEKQSVTLGGRPVLYRPFVYIMLNKPEGYVSATEDKKLPCVTELLSDRFRKMELFPVGRLDRDTVGLMILTNDGQTAHALLSPRRHVEKIYRFRAASPLSAGCEEKFAAGLAIDGYVCKPATLVCNPDRTGGDITLTEGKYHQIKRMLEAVDNRITFLERISFGGIPLDCTLARGEYRELTEAETAALFEKAQK